MFKHLQRISLLAAWAILFAHSVVPHAHEAKDELAVCATSHQHDEGLMDVLSHIFHFSTGVEHLEDYSLSNDLNLTALVPESVPQHVVIQQPLAPISPSIFVFSQEQVRYRPLRAPPAYS